MHVSCGKYKYPRGEKIEEKHLFFEGKNTLFFVSGKLGDGRWKMEAGSWKMEEGRSGQWSGLDNDVIYLE